jgi:hypothetical protein
MSSILKVDQIQLADGSIPTAGDLGISNSTVQVATNSLPDYLGTFSGATWNDSGLSLTFTPKYANSKILIMVTGSMRINGSVGSGVNEINRGAIRILNTTTDTVVFNEGYYEMMQARNSSSVVIPEMNYPFAATAIDTPNSTSTQVYKVQGWINSGSSGYITHNGTSHITAIEIAG